MRKVFAWLALGVLGVFACDDGPSDLCPKDFFEGQMIKCSDGVCYKPSKVPASCGSRPGGQAGSSQGQSGSSQGQSGSTGAPCAIDGDVKCNGQCISPSEFMVSDQNCGSCGHACNFDQNEFCQDGECRAF